MKRLKRLASLLLTAVLALTMAGCSIDDLAQYYEYDYYEDAYDDEVLAGDTEELPAETESPAEETADETGASEETSAASEEAAESPDSDTNVTNEEEQEEEITYYFRSSKLLNQHYEKHGIDMGFASAEEYEAAADAVIHNPDALSKIEEEDGDYVFYVEATNEFVVLSTDGYIRTYFLPDAGIDYYNRQ